MKTIEALLAALQAQLPKLARLKKHALEVQTIGARRTYERAYRDLILLAEDLTREAKLQQVDLELLAVREWKPDPPKQKRSK